MPKIELPITSFSGGENSDADARNLQQGQMAAIRNLSNDKFGKLRAAGQLQANSAVPASLPGGLLSVDLDNNTPKSVVLGHAGSTVANAPVALSLPTSRPVLSFFAGGIRIADGSIGTTDVTRQYYRRQNRSAVGGSETASWQNVIVSSNAKNPFSASNNARVAVTSDEALRSQSQGTPKGANYEIGSGPVPDQVIIFGNLVAQSIDLAIFYESGSPDVIDVKVEDHPGLGRVNIRIPYDGNRTASAINVINKVNQVSTMVNAAKGSAADSYNGSGAFRLIEWDAHILASATQTSATVENFDNARGTLWQYSNADWSNFRLRSRGITGRVIGATAAFAPSVSVSGQNMIITNAPAHSKGDTFDLYPSASGAISIHFMSEEDDTAPLPTTTVQFGVSYVFHEYFDTPPNVQGMGVKLYGGYGYNAQVLFNASGLPSGADAIRVWARDGEAEDWLLFCEIDFGKGYRFFGQEDYQALKPVAGSVSVYECGPVRVNEFGAVSYRSVNGYDATDAIGASYRAVAYSGGRQLAFGVNQASKVDSDRILVSPSGRPDLLPEKNFIVFSTEDGDEYQVAESFGDKIIAWKRRKVFIVNVSSNDPAGYFVEAEFDGMGVDSANQVCRGDFGIFWANKNGIHGWLDQGAPRTLTAGLIESFYRATYSSAENVSIGFNPINKTLVCVLSGSSSSHLIVYEFGGGSFTIITSSVAGARGNAAWTGSDLVFSRPGGTGHTFSDTPVAHSSAKVESPNYDMGAPGARKKVKRFQASFNRALTSGEKAALGLSWRKDNTSAWTTISDANFVRMGNTTSYQYRFPLSETCYAVQLKLEGAWPSDLELLDLSVIYKPKRPK